MMTLKPEDWNFLKGLYTANVSLAAPPHTTSLALALMVRSLHYNRFDCFLNARSLIIDPRVKCVGLPGSRSTIWRHFKSLVDSRLIFIKTLPAPYRAPKTRHCIINIPGFLSFLKAQLSTYSHKIDTRDMYLRLGSLFEKVKVYFKGRGWPLMSLTTQPKITTLMSEGLEKSRVARARKQAKRNQAGQFKAAWIQSQMREYCEEVGADFSDTWRGKEFGSARYWLDQCELQGKDPKAILYDVCLHWVRFRSDLTHEESGKPIRLPETVSFSKYFIYRREIESWLAVNRDAPVKSEPVEVITLKRINR